MAKRKRGYWAVHRGQPNPATAALAAQVRGEETFNWPAEPSEVVRVWGATDAPYAIDVEFVRDSDGNLVPVGVSVRRAYPTSRHKQQGRYQFANEAALEPLLAVDVRQIPFGRVIRAALAAADAELEDDISADVDRILVPRGRPQRGKSVKFYRDLLKSAHEFRQQGLSPAKEIARRKGVSPNLVHQWLHVARRLPPANGE